MRLGIDAGVVEKFHKAIALGRFLRFNNVKMKNMASARRFVRQGEILELLETRRVAGGRLRRKSFQASMCLSLALRMPACMSSRRLLKPKLWTLRALEPWLRNLRTASRSELLVDNRAAVAEGAEVLLNDEAGGGGVAQLPDFKTITLCADSLGIVLDHEELCLRAMAEIAFMSAHWP